MNMKVVIFYVSLVVWLFGIYSLITTGITGLTSLLLFTSGISMLLTAKRTKRTE